ncbi:MAG: signal recognition particle protein [candidate division Zixibacteria bacterium]|nr:signal recognition particle protein [candidate division Zixibacteria bacterium]
MFSNLSDRLDGVFKTLRGHGKITEANVKDALKQVRRALLEADVNYKVVKSFLEDVQTESMGDKVLQSVTPGQQMIKIIYDKMVDLLGGQHRPVRFAKSPQPTIWMVVGLQGSGKTTTCGKLALHFKKAGRNPHMIAADLQRPAAIEQLKTLGQQVGVDVHTGTGNPVDVAINGVKTATDAGADLIILDTAGRLHIDDQLMGEVSSVKEKVEPTETIFVADALTGQDAVTSASSFAERVGIDGVIFTKIDGDARGGAALSVVKATGVPILFVGTGEKLDGLEPFHPDRMVSRILGMGDVVSLVEKAQENFDEENAAALEDKLRKAQFDFEDFYEQLQQLKKMGPLESVLGMIPGVGKQLKGMQVDERAQGRMEAMILSMTPYERRHPEVLNGSRRMRIAKGSGNTIQDVNRLLKQFQMMKKMIKQMSKGGMKGMPKMQFPF